MDWVAVNDKVIISVKDVEKKSIFSDNDLGNLRIGEVLSVGENVTEVNVGGEILLPIQDITFLESKIGVCSERNIIAFNSNPIHNKLEIKLLPKNNELSKMIKGEVVKTSIDSKFKIGDIVSFKINTYSVLPSNNILINEDKIFLKNN